MTTESLPVWNLGDLLSEQEVTPLIEEIRSITKELAQKKEIFVANMSIEAFKEILDKAEVLDRKVGILGSYASNAFATNMKDQQAQALVGTVQSLGIEMQEALLFIDQEFKRFDKSNAQRLIAGVPEYAYHLQTVRKDIPHTLSDEVERIIAIKDVNGANALTTLYEMLTSGFTFSFEGKEYTREEVAQFVQNPDGAKRKKAYESLLAPYNKNKEVLYTIYKHLIDDWSREAKLRNYPQAISVRNAANDIPDSAIETLFTVCKKNVHIFQKYHKKKAQLLGTEKLSRYDLYAPIGTTEEKISYDQAIKTVLDVFKEFHSEVYTCAKEIIDKEHIHATVQENKQHGAYCSTSSPEQIPYILTSYVGTADSVSALAHEIGHGIHFMLAKDQNAFHFHAPTPICETASVFSEVLLTRKIMQENPALAKELIVKQLDEFYGTVSRQIWFSIFERYAHEHIEEQPSVDELAQIYHEQLKEQFGDMDIPEEFSYEWLSIPHIFASPFYCYAYTFGCLLSLAMYGQYQKDHTFAEKIITFLAKGGSQEPAVMVKELGFDIADEKFWQAGFDVIQEMIEQI